MPSRLLARKRVGWTWGAGENQHALKNTQRGRRLSNIDHLSTGFSDLKALGNGRFFITEKDYTGLGPPDCQAEDRIAILLGADVPFTLRRCGDRGDEFQLTGETYL